MLRRRLLPLVALLALALGAPAAAQAAPPRGFFGVMVNGPVQAPGFDLAAEARTMRAAGVESWRTEFAWDQLEPQRGQYDWSSTDRRMAAAAQAGTDVLALVVRAPRWASGSGDPFVPPRSPADLAGFFSAAIARYGPQGAFWAENPALPRRPIRTWQVWNEPNIAQYFRAQPFARPYARLLKASARAIRAADRGATVVMAGLANFSWRDLAKAYTAGVRPWFDAAAVHPFSGRPSNSLKIARLNRAAMDRAGDRRKPMWLTELTWSSAKGKKARLTKGWETTEAGQAQRLRQAYGLFLGARRALRLQRIFWYTWATVDRDSPNSFDYSGLRTVRADGTLADKPALGAFRAVARAARR